MDMERVPFLIAYRQATQRSAIREIGEKYGFAVDQEANVILETLQQMNALALRRAEKYQFDASASAMLQAVSVSQPATWLPLLEHTWIEFQQPLNTPFGEDIRAFWIHHLYTARELAMVVPAQKEKARYQAGLDSLQSSQHHWGFTILTGQHKDFFTFTYDTAHHEFLWLESYDCPFHTCQYGHAPTLTGRGGIVPCQHCREALDFWARWLHAAIRMIRREFALAPRMPADYPVHTEEYPEQTRVKVGKGKNARLISQTVTRQVDYRLVSFEVSEISAPVRAQAQEIIKHEEEAEAAHHRVSNWLTLADKDAIVWEYRQIDTSRGRVLDPARNPRWKSYQHIAVTPHKKWVPMLKPESKTIKRVHARRYAPQKDE